MSRVGFFQSGLSFFIKLSRYAVQKYFRFDEHKWFYDLESIVSNAGTPEDMLMTFYDELDRCIIYKAATERFLDLKINEHCGLSMYLPYSGLDRLKVARLSCIWSISLMPERTIAMFEKPAAKRIAYVALLPPSSSRRI